MNRRTDPIPQEDGAPMADAAELERSIRRLTAMLRGEWWPPEHRNAPENGWWVLAVGEPYGLMGLPDRDAARDRLSQAVGKAGVQPKEYVWVWDETDRAQLVLATLPSEERARRLAERYRSRGLEVRVARAFGDG